MYLNALRLHLFSSDNNKIKGFLLVCANRF